DVGAVLVGVLVRGDDHVGVRVRLDDLVRPRDLVLGQPVVEVQEQVVGLRRGDDVVVLRVVVLAAAVPRVVLVAVLAEVARVGGIAGHRAVGGAGRAAVGGAGGDVVVALDDPVREVGVVPSLHGGRGVRPLRALSGDVDDVAGEEAVAELVGLGRGAVVV